MPETWKRYLQIKRKIFNFTQAVGKGFFNAAILNLIFNLVTQIHILMACSITKIFKLKTNILIITTFSVKNY